MLHRHLHRAIGARAFGMRRGDVIGVAGQAIADHLGIDFRAARLGVLIFLEHDDARALAHDEAVAVLVIGPAGLLGRSLKLVESARAWAKPAMPIGQIAASAPPASMTSASSIAIIRAASPIEWAPVEQAVTTAWFGPISPYLIETWPEIRLIRRPWTKCGETRRGPFARGPGFRFSMPGQAANARADRDAGAVALLLGHVGQAGILDRLAGGVDAVDDERIDLALDLVVDALVGIEAIFMIRRLHLAGDLAGIILGIEMGDPRRRRSSRRGCCSSSSRRRRPAARPGPRPVTTTRRISSLPKDQMAKRQTAPRLGRGAVPVKRLRSPPSAATRQAQALFASI